LDNVVMKTEIEHAIFDAWSRDFTHDAAIVYIKSTIGERE